MIIARCNYLNRGHLLENADVFQRKKEDIVKKKDLINCLTIEEYEVISTYGGRKRNTFESLKLNYDIEQSRLKKTEFREMGCRGFSYYFLNDMKGFPLRLRKEINLRVALVASKDLFYPLDIWREIARHRRNHYFYNASPAIAFALGSIVENRCYIFALQSDILKGASARVREHFRGWRKVIFIEILRYLKQRKIKAIYLLHEKDVHESCHDGYKVPATLPTIWKNIYSGTARDFGMTMSVLDESINAQLYYAKPEKQVGQMFSKHI